MAGQGRGFDLESRRVAEGRPQWAERCGDALLLASLAWSVLAIAGTLPWSVAGLLGIVALSTVTSLGLGRFRFDGGVLVLLSLSVWVSLQTAPVPPTLLGVIDSGHGDTWQRVLRLLDRSGPAAFSLEPDTTRYEAVRLACYALTWGAASGHAKAHGPLVMARWVTWLVVAAASITVLHRVLGVHQVYGSYAPSFANSRWVGPLLNPNNLGGFCNLGVFCALACSSRHAGGGKPIYFAVAAALACLTVLSGSRGATVALAGGVLLFLAAWLRARRTVPRVQHWGLVYALVVASTLVALTLDRSTIEDLSGRSVEKLSLIGWGWAVFSQHPWAGVGMGAFGAEAATVSGHSGNVAFPYVECFPLDLLTGLGLPLAALAIGSVCFGVLRIGGGLRTHAMRLGLCVVLLQNLMDLGLSVPGLALPWLGVFAACWGGATRRTWATADARVGWVSAVGALALGSVLTFPLAKPVGLLRRQLSERINTAEGEAQLDDALARYPGDAYLLRIKAAVALRDDSPKALTWVNAALLRAPSDARTHLLLAKEMLSRRRVEQALPSLRLAAMDRSLHPDIARLIGLWPPERLIAAAPDGPFGSTLLRLIAGNRSGDERITLLEAAERRAPDDAHTAAELMQARLRRASGETERCEVNSPCHRELSSGVERVNRLGASASQVHVLRALLLALSGAPRSGFELLLAQCERSPQARSCLQVLVELGSRVGPREFEQAVSVFLDSVCGGQTSCSSERLAMAAQLTRQGSIAKAHELYVQECSASGSIDAFILAARTAMQLGRAREALHWLEKGEQRHRADPTAVGRFTTARADLSTKIQASTSALP